MYCTRIIDKKGPAVIVYSDYTVAEVDLDGARVEYAIYPCNHAKRLTGGFVDPLLYRKTRKAALEEIAILLQVGVVGRD